MQDKTFSVTNRVGNMQKTVVQLAKKRVREYANNDDLKNLVYFVAGNLKMGYPDKSLETLFLDV